MPRRLAAELRLPPLELLPDVAVADLRADEADAVLLEGRFEPAIRHHRADHHHRGQLAVLREVPRRERQHEVPIEDGATAVDGHDPVAVAVEREADIRLVLHDGLLQRSRRGCTASEVDVRPIGRVEEREDLRAGAGEDRGGDAIGRAVRTVEHHPQPIELGRDRAEKILVLLYEAADVPDQADAALRRPREHRVVGHRRLDPVLGRVGQLEARMVEELDPVVGRRVVRRADHSAGDHVLGPCEVREARGRDMPDEPDVHAHGAEPGREGALEHAAGPPGVAPDDHRVARPAEDVPGRPAEAQGELGREVEVRDPADAVGTEQPAHLLLIVSVTRSGCSDVAVTPAGSLSTMPAG